MNNALGKNDFFVANTLTGADIMLIFVCEAAGGRLEPYKNLVRYRDAIHARPAYQRTIEKGGEYQLMSR
jgi:glutathione S-transferase